MKHLKKLFLTIKNSFKESSIQYLISVSFTLITVVSLSLIGIFIFNLFEDTTKDLIVENNTQILDQASMNIDEYIRNMMQISDSTYYSVIKNKDLSKDTMDTELNLLYEANKDNLVSIACFDYDGSLVAATPVTGLKTYVDVTSQDWYTIANDTIENVHFSTPHVQNIFENTGGRYYWVVSLSRAVELTDAGNTRRGVLLVDMNYSGIERLFNKINSKGQGYTYLISGDGEIIYHPKQKLIYSKLYEENSIVAASYEDGSHQETYNGEERIVIVKTIGYTGWKIVSVTPTEEFALNIAQQRTFVLIIVVVAIIILTLVNTFVSYKIADPIKKLDSSVKDLEKGNLDLDIYIGGTSEIKHLGTTIRSVVAEMRRLMDDIVVEQEKKRKSELDALQSQINPHFLYNTLDSVIWMVENERYDEAITMVTALAGLFRISISKGKNIITIEDEFKHANNYLSIQKIRYKNSFSVVVEVEKDILKCCTIKLIIQPLVENAIYYGVECLGDEGEIKVLGYSKGDKIYIDVIDNGVGIKAEDIPLLLTDDTRVRRKGSGIGLKNVHQRIQIYFGPEYGVQIMSELDEGTTIRICIPKIYYDDVEEKDGYLYEKS